jgi:hypothetical protein
VTFGGVFVRKYVAPIRIFIVPNGCSTFSRRAHGIRISDLSKRSIQSTEDALLDYLVEFAVLAFYSRVPSHYSAPGSSGLDVHLFIVVDEHAAPGPARAKLDPASH